MRTLEETKEFFSNDRFATDNGMIIESVGDKSAVCSLCVTPGHMNAVGNVMGGVYYTLADFTFAVATNHEEMGTVSLSSSIEYLAPARGKKIICTAECLKDGRTTCNYEMKLEDEDGKLLAIVHTTGFTRR